MDRRPTTFGQLLGRIAPAAPAGAFACQPMIASAVELENGDVPLGRPIWIVLHSITDAHVRLIHSQPIGAEKLAVRLEAASGEVLRVILEKICSRQQGELFETCAGFVQLAREIHSVSA